MELIEALETIEATLGMFSTFVAEIEDGYLKEEFLKVPVFSSVEKKYDINKQVYVLESKSYYNYTEGNTTHKSYIVDIHPVCSCMVNEWPSYKAMRIRKTLNEVYHVCVDYCKCYLDEDTINSAFGEGYNYYNYNRRYNESEQGSRNIVNVMLDTIHEMYHALGLTEDDEEDPDDVDIFFNNDQTITEEVASQIDWQRETHDFDIDEIMNIVDSGRTIQEKMVIIHAIYDSAEATGYLYKIPYGIDLLLIKHHTKHNITLNDIETAFKTFLSSNNNALSTKEKEEDIIHEIAGKEVDELCNRASNMLESMDTDADTSDDDSLIDNALLPEELKTDEAKQLMLKLVDAGLLTADWQPQNLSISERGYLVKEIAIRLKIKAKWKVMAKLWDANPETLRQGCNRAFDQTKTQSVIEKVKKILG